MSSLVTQKDLDVWNDLFGYYIDVKENENRAMRRAENEENPPKKSPDNILYDMQ
jgi:hypothetical protein